MARCCPVTLLTPAGAPASCRKFKNWPDAPAPAAFARIVALVNSDDERIALAASQEILNRAYGRPVMQVNSDVRRVDLSSVWAATMQAISERQRQASADALTAPSENEIVDVTPSMQLEETQTDW
jgi:hypothetical protein